MSVTSEDLELINSFAKTELSAEQVYVFSVILCDNDIDRDYERFTEDSLNTLAGLFVGKSGIFDHNWTADGQTARIYRTRVVHNPEKSTADGAGYCYLEAWVYMLRTDKNADLIAEIEGGIKKEVSISCSIDEKTCSICGNSAGRCEHVPGRVYDGQTCYMELCNPTDAYEFSFVAVPAQRNAGVMKKYSNVTVKKGRSKHMTIEELREKYPDQIAQLEKAAADAAVEKAAEEAANAERNRLQEIDDIAPAIDAALVKEAKYGEKPCTAAELSHRAVLRAAQQGKAFMADAMKDYQESGAKDVHALPVEPEADIKKEKTPAEKQQEARQAVKALLHPDNKEG